MAKEKKDELRLHVDAYVWKKKGVESLGEKIEVDEEFALEGTMEELKAQMLDCLEKDGKVFVYHRNKKLAAYFLFVKEQDAKDESKKQYRLVSEGICPRYQEQYEDVKNVVISMVSEWMGMDNMIALQWGEVRYELPSVNVKVGKKNYNVSFMLMGLAIGALLWMMTGEVLYFCLGMCVGFSLGAIGETPTPVATAVDEESDAAKEEENEGDVSDAAADEGDASDNAE